MSFTRRRLGMAIGTGAATALVLAACAGEDGFETTPGFDDCSENPDQCNSGERTEGGEITFLVNQGHDGVYNPLTSTGNSVYMNQMRQGINAPPGWFLPSGEWEYNLDLLESEPELLSEDPLTLRYTIRDEAVWSDGEPINIDDVEFQQKHQSGREEDCSDCAPASTSFYDTTVSIEAEDDAGKVIVITYEDGWIHPEWFARDLLTHPAHIADAEGFDWRNDPDAMAEASEFFSQTVPTWSAGPYVVERWVADETQVLVPNENWYGETRPTLDMIVKEVVTDQPSWIPATANRELHGGAPASFTMDLEEQLAEIPGVYTGITTNTYSWDHVDVNMDSIDDVALRRAIFTAIDVADARERIWGELDDPPAMRTGLFLPQFNEYHQDHLTETGYGTGDVETARSILEDAGYTGYDSGETLTAPDGSPVQELRFAFLAGNENRNTFTQLAQSYLAEIGLTVTPEATPGDRLGTVLAEQDYDLVIFGWSGNPLIANGPFQFYHSTSPSNFGNLNNPEIDALVAEARNQFDLETTAEIHQQTIQLVLEEAYSLPLWDTPDLIWVGDEYTNIRDNSAFQPRAFYNTAEWGVLAVE